MGQEFNQISDYFASDGLEQQRPLWGDKMYQTSDAGLDQNKS